ncbi:MAG: helix-turn-helix transcriptional regulator [Patescibacteria group bacterium]
MKDWEEVKKKLLENEEVKREYDRLGPRYEAIGKIIEARLKKKMTQKELAEKLGTKQSAIARFEAGNINPSLAFLQKLATVLGYRLTVTFTK